MYVLRNHLDFTELVNDVHIRNGTLGKSVRIISLGICWQTIEINFGKDGLGIPVEFISVRVH